MGTESRRVLLVAVLFAAMAGLAALDLFSDLREGTSTRHAVAEGLIVLSGLLGAGLLVYRVVELRQREREAHQELAGLQKELHRSRADGERWKAEARDLLAGLSELIERQLGIWGLTPAEKGVALLLLKGLSHKEVASVRGVSEATARQQAAAVYRKAGLTGRHDLAAFFLEDLLAPRGDG